MNSDEIFINGRLYNFKTNNSKLTIKRTYRFGLFNMPSSKEKELVEFELKKDKSNIFRSKKLNEIAKINPQITKVDILCSILDKIEFLIPTNLRRNFYKNLETLDIQIVKNISAENYYREEVAVGGRYDIEGNVLFLNAKEVNLYNKKNNFNEDSMANIYAERVLIHEMLHLASSSKENDKPGIKSGVLTEDEYYNVFNVSLNEGITENLTTKISRNKDADIKSGYDYYIKIVEQLINLVGYDTIVNSYFGNAGTKYMKYGLFKIIPDYFKAESFFFDFSTTRAGGEINREMKKVIMLQHILLEYFDKLADKCIKEGRGLEILDLVTCLHNNFIDLGQDCPFDYKDENYMNRLNKNKIEEKCLNTDIVQRKRK